MKLTRKCTTSFGHIQRSHIARGGWLSSRHTPRFATLSILLRKHTQRRAHVLARRGTCANKSCSHRIGYEALRARAADQVRRRLRRLATVRLRLRPTRHLLLVVEVLGTRLCRRCYGEPEPFPCHSRDIPQFGIPIAAGQQVDRDLCQSAHRLALQRFFQGMSCTETSFQKDRDV